MFNGDFTLDSMHSVSVMALASSMPLKPHILTVQQCTVKSKKFQGIRDLGLAKEYLPIFASPYKGEESTR